MKQSNFTAYAFTAILSVLAAYVIGIGQTLDSFTFTLDDDQYAACGLNKLSPEELSTLFAFIESVPRISYLEESGANYLRSEGWKVAQVFGVQRLKAKGSDSELEYLVGVDEQGVHLLRLTGFGGRLSPGWYWVETSTMTWNILQPDGENELYWIEETR